MSFLSRLSVSFVLAFWGSAAGCSGNGSTATSNAPEDGGDSSNAPIQDSGAANDAATVDASIPETSTDGSTPTDGLGGGNGIKGTFGGKTYTATFGAARVPQQTATVLIGASTAQYPPADSWAVRFLPTLGTQQCNGADGPGDPAISFRSTANPNLIGTTGTKGTCVINVTSLSPKFEGTFSASIPSGDGTHGVTDGYFRIAN